LVCYHGESLTVNCHDFDVSRIVLVSGITIQKEKKEWSQPCGLCILYVLRHVDPR